MAAEAQAASGARMEGVHAAANDATATRLVCLFHLNLAYSSLEEDTQADIVRRCYWPLLDLVEEAGFPLALEATGFTLRRIAAIDPPWLERMRALLHAGRLELVGSAHAQCAAPLLPAEVNEWNLRLGRDTYVELLGVAPRVALVCEQVFAPGLVPLFLDAGYEAIVIDWDNAYRSHRDWPLEHRRHPQLAVGGGREIPALWSESIAFQKFQRHAHGELSLERYLEFVRDAAGGLGGMFVLYANDAEVFDHRPGRFAAEPELTDAEWTRVARCLRALREDGVGEPALPSDALALLGAPSSGQRLVVEAPDQPIPVKKQDKYNVTRWAVTGRDDVGINTRCGRVYERLRAGGSSEPERWAELCELWASDYRTHITESRWHAHLARLERAEQRVEAHEPHVGPSLRPGADVPPGAIERDGSFLELRAAEIALRLNVRRGLAIDALCDRSVDPRPLVGTLEHGYFPTIELGADFYSGHLVQEAAARAKVTDLERVEPAVGVDEQGRLCALAEIATPLGPIAKAVRLDAASRSVELEWALRWSELPAGSLRFGYVTLLPEAFDESTLWYAAHNGGRTLDVHAVRGAAFDHGGAVSALVSARQGLGVTEGIAMIGDAERTVRVELDHACARPLGLVSWSPTGERWLLRLAFALTESDDTRRGPIPRDPRSPQRARMRISLARTDQRLIESP